MRVRCRRDEYQEMIVILYDEGAGMSERFKKSCVNKETCEKLGRFRWMWLKLGIFA